MEFDQLLYKKLSSFFSKRRNRPTEDILKKLVSLEENKSQWIVLAQAITGATIKIVPAEKEGGFKESSFFLPPTFHLLSSRTLNELYYKFRIFYMSYLHINFDELDQNLETHYIKEEGLINAKVLNTLFHDFPFLEHIYHELISAFQAYYTEQKTDFSYSWLLGKWMPSREKTGATEKLSDELGSHALPKAKTEIKAKPVDEVESLHVNKKAQEDYTLMHNFEKVETIEEFSGPWRDFDGDDELEQHEEALNHIDLRHTVRVDDETHSVYQSEFISNAHIPESDEVDISREATCYIYDEWDHSKLSYKKEYCKVFEKQCYNNNEEYLQSTLASHKSVISILKKQLANFFNKLEEIKKLNQGENIDMDALTDLFIDQQAGKPANDKIYVSKRNHNRDIAILFLLDLSLSSDGYAGGNRILDVEKQMAIVIGELLSEYDIPFQIDGFSSKTRNYCAYTTFKKFNDSWSKKRKVIGSITPEGYTRIGPALRHARSIMEKQEATKKWLVILSDGKPNDYDKYEGSYGIADVKQAIRELNASHIGVHTFAIDQNAKFYLPQIFGKANYNVLAHPKEMLLSIIQFCERIMTA